MAFEPGPKYRMATDNDTGAVITVRGIGSSMQFERVEFSQPGGPTLGFEVELKGIGEPNVIINALILEANFRALGRTNEPDNSDLVAYILRGLAAINRKWALMRHTQFGSNYEECVRSGAKFSFLMPSNEQLRQLTA